MVIQNQNFSTKKQRIRVVTRYQNLIRFYYWQKVIDENKKWLLRKFITKNQGITVITRYQNLIKICYWQKAVGKNKSGYSEPEVHHKEPENKGDYSVSEPREDLFLTKSRWEKTKSGYSESEIHHK